MLALVLVISRAGIAGGRTKFPEHYYRSYPVVKCLVSNCVILMRVLLAFGLHGFLLKFVNGQHVIIVINLID